MAGTQGAPRIHWRPLRAVLVLRVLVLMVLAGFVLAVVMSYGRRGSPQTEITMAPASATPAQQGPVVDRSDEFEVNGSREGRPAFTLRAKSVTGFAGDRKLLEGVRLTIHDGRGGQVTVSGLEGQFDAAERRARLSGDVTVEGVDEGLSLRTGTLFYDNDRDMIFTADDIAFSVGGLEGEGRGMNYLVAERQIKIPDRVVLRIATEGTGGPIRISSGDLVASLGRNTAVFTDNVRMESRGDVLYGNYLKVQFDESRKLVRQMNAFGDVVATGAPGPGGEVNEMRADSLAAEFGGPKSALRTAEASGNCRVTSGAITSRSRSARYRAAEDRVELRGDPVLMTATDRIAAQEIDVTVGGRALQARGDVRTVSQPGPAGAPGAPGFAPRSPISFQARTLAVDQKADRAVYGGAARVWQEGNSLQGEEIVIDRAARQLQATGNVMGRFTARPAKPGGSSARPVVTAITASSLVLDDAQGVGRYRDNVRLTREDAVLTADAMDAFLAERDGSRVLDRIEARGSVAIKKAQSFGTARTALYQAGPDLLILEDDGGLAEVVDAATGRTLRGRTLTFDLAGDRILTESARGGRTWITLKPEAKDVQPVEPKIKH
ncbi:MAG TPA: LptA/OstA family protein [Candidatus Polarisedimenticolia bacterium]|jgi:lipopolysaccharide export system protein LptA|nr:LptA/OstA family protein [Candidatus Polarisedimenticolia bacterium]